MASPVRRNVKLMPSTAKARADVRSWRDEAEAAGRDRRPGNYSVTGEFVRLEDHREAAEDNPEPPSRLA